MRIAIMGCRIDRRAARPQPGVARPSRRSFVRRGRVAVGRAGGRTIADRPRRPLRICMGVASGGGNHRNPVVQHVPLALDAARRGCDLFVEKPLGGMHSTASRSCSTKRRAITSSARGLQHALSPWPCRGQAPARSKRDWRRAGGAAADRLLPTIVAAQRGLPAWIQRERRPEAAARHLDWHPRDTIWRSGCSAPRPSSVGRCQACDVARP